MSFKFYSGIGRIARLRETAIRAALVAAVAGLLAGCEDDSISNARAYRAISQQTLDVMTQKGTNRSAPVLIRTYKKEAELEIWKQRADGHYVHLKTYPMCRWSGQLGPKTREGDRQVPEGFYAITPGQMNPNSNYYLSFNVGYPNAYDRAHGYGGGLIMVHGACSSAGCFSMTDEQIAEIYAILREGFAGGQREIQMQSYPFRMNAENLAKFRLDPNLPFWKELKKGADTFEVSERPVKVGACGRHYVFGAKNVSMSDASEPCPTLETDPDIARAVAQKERDDETKVAELVSKGVKPVRLVYADGGQNPEFSTRPGDVSRPEALAQGPTEIVLDDKPVSPAVKVAAAKGAGSNTLANSTAAIAAASPVSAAMSPVADAPSTTSESGVMTPIYSRLLGFVGMHEDKPAEVAEPAIPQPDKAPLPPRRKSANASNAQVAALVSGR